MNDFLIFCPACKTVYEIERHHVRPLAEPVCETCQQALPVADGNDWLTYRIIRSQFVHVSRKPRSQVAQQG
jgi:predicted Zn finger-like uncharacterized protein